MVRTGDQIKIDGNVYTVKSIFKVFLVETKRYRTDPNPIPAGTVVANLSGGGLNRRVLRPGSFEIV